MSNFTPGEGWREASQEEALRAKVPTLILDGLASKRYWVQEEPVPPFPTEPYTVIRVTWKSAHQQRTRPRHLTRLSEEWYEIGSPQPVFTAALRSQITSFEVLSEPRNATVDYIADEMRKRSGNQYDAAAAALVRDYGDGTVLL